MEFQYNNKDIKLSIFIIIVICLAAALFVKNYVTGVASANYAAFSIAGLLMLFYFTFGFRILHFCYKKLGSTVILDERGITGESKKSSFFISWEEVEHVDVIFLSGRSVPFAKLLPYFGRSLFIIKIIGNKQTVEIGSHLNNFPILVKLLKEHLQGKFDTTLIPVEYKYLQK